MVGSVALVEWAAVIGLDLLEIDRLEDALARRPALAERLFTEGERSYAATQGARRAIWRRASAPRRP
jgi:phosphopantetheinyl transferase (holo-ACP synthase)